MRSSSGRRELAFVVGVAGAGLALVLLVVFAPWYPVVIPDVVLPALTQVTTP